MPRDSSDKIIKYPVPKLPSSQAQVAVAITKVLTSVPPIVPTSTLPTISISVPALHPMSVLPTTPPPTTTVPSIAWALERIRVDPVAALTQVPTVESLFAYIESLQLEVLSLELPRVIILILFILIPLILMDDFSVVLHHSVLAYFTAILGASSPGGTFIASHIILPRVTTGLSVPLPLASLCAAPIAMTSTILV